MNKNFILMLLGMISAGYLSYAHAAEIEVTYSVIDNALFEQRFNNLVETLDQFKGNAKYPSPDDIGCIFLEFDPFKEYMIYGGDVTMAGESIKQVKSILKKCLKKKFKMPDSVDKSLIGFYGRFICASIEMAEQQAKTHPAYVAACKKQEDQKSAAAASALNQAENFVDVAAAEADAVRKKREKRQRQKARKREEGGAAATSGTNNAASAQPTVLKEDQEYESLVEAFGTTSLGNAQSKEKIRVTLDMGIIRAGFSKTE